jgi:hypothetical protein
MTEVCGLKFLNGINKICHARACFKSQKGSEI